MRENCIKYIVAGTILALLGCQKSKTGSNGGSGVPPRTPPGYHLRVTLNTTGIAPFAQHLKQKSNLVPFIFAVDNDSFGFLAKNDRKRADRCEVSAYGVSSNRAGMVLQRLSCVDKSGQKFLDIPITGYVLDTYLQPDLPGNILQTGVEVKSGQKAIAIIEEGITIIARR